MLRPSLLLLPLYLPTSTVCTDLHRAPAALHELSRFTTLVLLCMQLAGAELTRSRNWLASYGSKLCYLWAFDTGRVAVYQEPRAPSR